MTKYKQAFIILFIGALPVSLLWSSGHHIASSFLGIMVAALADSWICYCAKREEG